MNLKFSVSTFTTGKKKALRDSKRHGLQPYPFRAHQHLDVLIVLGDTLGVSWIFP